MTTKSWLPVAGTVRVSVKKQSVIFEAVILALIFVLAFAARLFAVLRFESVIHEFDPYFNFRSTRYLVENGVYNFLNWFDETGWYPLGRIVGFTVYPGLMMTAASVHWILNAFNFTVQVRNVCVLLAPFFASNTVLATYFLTREVADSRAGLFAAAFISIVPGYISRSVGGSFDNEGVAIFALVFTFFLWVRAVRTGSLLWSCFCTLSYFYMVAAWGGYVFIINIIPLHVLVLILMGRFNNRIYVAYSTFYVLGTLLAMQVRFVGFQAVQSSEHMASLGVFGLVQLVACVEWVRATLPPDLMRRVIRLLISTVVGGACAALAIGMATGYISPWSGRFYSMFDPTYAKVHIPIIASVSEHQPTTWASYFFDLHILVFLMPAGIYFCFQKLTDSNLFIVLYGVTGVYFCGVMVRLMLTLTPCACVLGGIAMSQILRRFMVPLAEEDQKGLAATAAAGGDSSSSEDSGSSESLSKRQQRKREEAASSGPLEGQWEISMVVVVVMALLSVMFVMHSVWVTSEAYSSPSIVLAARQPDGSRMIFDDFREAYYYWLRQNTPPETRIMSWWDYGYQLAAMANRTVLVDNNTWNNTHIAQVGKAFALPEEKAYPIVRSLDVDYILVIFGGASGYSSDDINKFLWMVRIAGSTDPNIKERDYLSKESQYRIDAGGSPTMLNSLMYKLCYYRFAEMTSGQPGMPTGYDRVRNAEIGNKEFELTHFEEAYSSEHYLVRLYRVKEPANRGW